jgi:hypothetical protein
MKNYLILFATLLCAFMACKKVETPTGESNMPIFTKSFVVNDTKGNSANVEVSGPVEDQINQMCSLQFELFTTTELPKNTVPQSPTPSNTQDAFADWNEENTISISVKSFDLQNGVTGFRLDLKPEFRKLSSDRVVGLNSTD